MRSDTNGLLAGRFRSTLSHFALVAAIALAAAPALGDDLGQRFGKVNGSTRWELLGRTRVDFNTFHPQGMARVGEDFFVSSVEVIDRAKGQGQGHLFRMSRDGKLSDSIVLSDGPRYHPGGIDFDGTRIWVPVAEYRPSSSSDVYVVDPRTLESIKVFSFPDHLGAIAHDPKHGLLVAMSWGSRNFYQWRTRMAGGKIEVLDVDRAQPISNHAHYVDFQDAQWIPGTTLMLCGGIKSYGAPTPSRGAFSLSGLELIGMTNLAPVLQIPVMLWDEGGRPMLQNPFHAELAEEGLRFYFMPADNDSTLYEFAIRP